MQSRIGGDRFVGHDLGNRATTRAIPLCSFPRFPGTCFLGCMVWPALSTCRRRSTSRGGGACRNASSPCDCLQASGFPRAKDRACPDFVCARTMFFLLSEAPPLRSRAVLSSTPARSRTGGSPCPLRVRSVDRPWLRRKGFTSTWTRRGADRGACIALQRVPASSSWPEGSSRSTSWSGYSTCIACKSKVRRDANRILRRRVGAF